MGNLAATTIRVVAALQIGDSCMVRLISNGGIPGGINVGPIRGSSVRCRFSAIFSVKVSRVTEMDGSVAGLFRSSRFIVAPRVNSGLCHCLRLNVSMRTRRQTEHRRRRIGHLDGMTGVHRLSSASTRMTGVISSYRFGTGLRLRGVAMTVISGVVGLVKKGWCIRGWS